jgi:hypothetical protein
MDPYVLGPGMPMNDIQLYLLIAPPVLLTIRDAAYWFAGKL